MPRLPIIECYRVVIYGERLLLICRPEQVTPGGKFGHVAQVVAEGDASLVHNVIEYGCQADELILASEPHGTGAVGGTLRTKTAECVVLDGYSLHWANPEARA